MHRSNDVRNYSQMLERISLAFHSCHLGHTCLCIVICLKICSFFFFLRGRGVKQNRQNMDYIAMCVNTYVLNLAFSSCECIFPFDFYWVIFLIGLFVFCFVFPTKDILGVVVSIFSVIPIPFTLLLVKQSHWRKGSKRKKTGICQWQPFKHL